MALGPTVDLPNPKISASSFESPRPCHGQTLWPSAFLPLVLDQGWWSSARAYLSRVEPTVQMCFENGIPPINTFKHVQTYSNQDHFKISRLWRILMSCVCLCFWTLFRPSSQCSGSGTWANSCGIAGQLPFAWLFSFWTTLPLKSDKVRRHKFQMH